MRSFATLTAAVVLAASSASANYGADVDATAHAVAEAIVGFSSQGLTPNPVSNDVFQPKAALTVTYPQAGVVGLNQQPRETQVQEPPTYTLNITDSEADQFKGKLFTVIVADPGAPVANYNGLVVRHFLANNITVGSDGTLRNTSAPVTRYFGPAPPQGSGPHRYMHLVVAQPANFRAPAALSQPNTPLVTDWNLGDYFSQAGLGPIVAASYMIVQNGTTTDASVTTAPAIDAAAVSATAASLETQFSSTASATAAPSGSSGSGNTGAAFNPLNIRGWAGLAGVTAGALFAGAAALLF
ncbi:hypothetical protein V8E36_007273 [Tilletia maclaganii]